MISSTTAATAASSATAVSAIQPEALPLAATTLSEPRAATAATTRQATAPKASQRFGSGGAIFCQSAPASQR